MRIGAMLLLASSLAATRWVHLADFTEVTSLVPFEHGLAASTTRGGVLFDTEQAASPAAWQHLSLADGMRSLQLRDVCTDGAGNLFWIGQDLGISALSSDGAASRGFLEFSEHAQISRVNDLFGASGFVLVGHSLGLTQFSYEPERDEFLVHWNLYRIADFPLQSEVLASAELGERLVVVTPQGVAIGTGYPERPQQWIRLAAPDMPGTISNVRMAVGEASLHLALASPEGDLWLGTMDDLGEWTRELDSLPEGELSGLTAEGAEWAFALGGDGSTRMFRNGEAGNPELVSGNTDAIQLLDGVLWMSRVPGAEPGGMLGLLPDGEQVESVPNVPGAAEFVDLDLAADGSVWVVGVAEDVRRNGLYQYMDGSWQDWRLGSGTFGNFPTSVACDTRGGIWVGGWGNGASRLDPATGDLQRFRHDSPAGQQIYGFRNNQVVEDETFCLVSDVEADAQGNVWLINHQAINDSCIVVVPAAWFDNPETPFGRAHYSQAGVRFPFYLERSPEGFVWVGIAGKDARDETKRVLWLSPFGHTVSGLRDWRVQDLELSDELYNFGFESNGYISGIKGDEQGNLWVATTNGFYQGGVYGGVAQFSRVLFIEGLLDEQLGGLDIDARGRVWLGSSSGLNVYDPRVTAFEDPSVATELQQLLRDQPGFALNCVKLNRDTGEIWAATNMGLFLCATGAEDYGNAPGGTIRMYPNPFRPEEGQRARLKAGSLANDARMSIYSLDGRLQRSLELLEIEDGWDGRDEAGELLDPGVYLLLVTSAGGSSEGKVAIIR